MRFTLKYIYLCLTIICLPKIGNADNGTQNNSELLWLQDFLSSGLHSFNVNYSIAHENSANNGLGIDERTEIIYYFETKDYISTYVFDYKDNWSVLTNNGSINPPEMKSRFVDSDIQPWTKYNDKVLGEIGHYREYHSRKVPNWLIFDRMDTLLLLLIRLNNPLPPITGIFYPDELKLEKKLYKQARKGQSISGLWSRFEYDEKGNVIELSSSFLQTKLDLTKPISKDILTFDIQLINKNKESIRIKPLISSVEPTIMDGILLEYGNNTVKIFNFELNEILFKFAPDIFRNPDNTILDYLRALQDDSGTQLERFDLADRK